MIYIRAVVRGSLILVPPADRAPLLLCGGAWVMHLVTDRTDRGHGTPIELLM